MEEKQVSGAAEEAIGALRSDFKIVGSHRVHSWYAWAIVGIVFGMALGIMYVANNTAQFVSSKAAQSTPSYAGGSAPVRVSEDDFPFAPKIFTEDNLTMLAFVNDQPAPMREPVMVGAVAPIKFNSREGVAAAAFFQTQDGKVPEYRRGDNNATVIYSDAKGNPIWPSVPTYPNFPRDFFSHSLKTWDAPFVSVRKNATYPIGTKVVVKERVTIPADKKIGNAQLSVATLGDLIGVTVNGKAMVKLVGNRDPYKRDTYLYPITFSLDNLKAGDNEIVFALGQARGNAEKNPVAVSYQGVVYLGPKTPTVGDSWASTKQVGDQNVSLSYLGAFDIMNSNLYGGVIDSIRIETVGGMKQGQKLSDVISADGLVLELVAPDGTVVKQPRYIKSSYCKQEGDGVLSCKPYNVSDDSMVWGGAYWDALNNYGVTFGSVSKLKLYAVNVKNASNVTLKTTFNVGSQFGWSQSGGNLRTPVNEVSSEQIMVLHPRDTK